MKPFRANLMLCAGTGCVSNHSFEVKQALEEEIKKRDLENEIQVVITGCDGFCAEGPIMIVQPDDIFYCRLTEKDIPHLVEEHFLTCRNAEGDIKYIICNADEGDPGAFMDRNIIESDPHSVLEAMAIGAYAIGVSEGYVYIRHEYPLARERLHTAINQAREYGLIGENIFDTGFDFDIKVVRGAGAFVCGESTALMASIEGRVGEPRAKYVHAEQRGNLGKCTGDYIKRDGVVYFNRDRGRQ